MRVIDDFISLSSSESLQEGFVDQWVSVQISGKVWFFSADPRSSAAKKVLVVALLRCT
jgi:hypothetical protein